MVCDVLLRPTRCKVLDVRRLLEAGATCDSCTTPPALQLGAVAFRCCSRRGGQPVHHQQSLG
jgi:hypothetical protein